MNPAPAPSPALFFDPHFWIVTVALSIFLNIVGNLVTPPVWRLLRSRYAWAHHWRIKARAKDLRRAIYLADHPDEILHARVLTTIVIGLVSVILLTANLFVVTPHTARWITVPVLQVVVICVLALVLFILMFMNRLMGLTFRAQRRIKRIAHVLEDCAKGSVVYVDRMNRFDREWFGITEEEIPTALGEKRSNDGTPVVRVGRTGDGAAKP